MVRAILLNLKRLAGNRAMLILPVLAPALLLLAFGSVVAPVFFSGGMEKFHVAVFNEDSSALTGSIISGLVEGEKSRGLISVRFVSSRAEGLAALADGDAALVTIPAGLQDTLRGGKQGKFSIRLNPDKPLESALLLDVLTSGVRLVNDAQLGVNALYGALADAGMTQDKASAEYDAVSRTFMLTALDRAAAIDVQGKLSPLGRLLPVEYYASALLAVFLFLGAMAVSGLTARDASNGVLDRYVSAGRGAVAFVTPRALSGAAFVALQGLPAIALVLLFTSSGFLYTGSVLWAFPALLLFALTVSCAGVFAGLLARSEDSAGKTVFLAVLGLALLGGAVIPAPGLGFLSGIAPYTVVNAAMRLFSNTLFYFDADDFLNAALVLAAYALVFAAGAHAAAARKA